MPQVLSDRKLDELRKAMSWSTKRLRPFRRNRLSAMKQFVGRNYSDHSDSATTNVPVNMIWLAVSIYMRQLVPVTPQCLVLTAFPELKPTALEMETALNHLLGEIRFGDTLTTVVMEALFCMGIMKVGLEIRDVGNELGWEHDAGQGFADAVLLDDWVHDMAATDYRLVSFAGNRYRMPYEYAMEGANFSASGKKHLTPKERSQFTSDGGEHRSETLSQGQTVYTDEYGKFVELWDLWLPRENLFITIPAGDSQGPPLEVREWEGPEHGPFHLLRFQPVPGNIMSIGPVQQWVDLSEGLNGIWRKLGRQAERQKEFYTVSGTAQKDGEVYRNVDDGDMISVQGEVATHRTGGIDQPNLAFAIQVQRVLGYLMGNLESIGGLSAQTSTLGQDEMLQQASGRLVDDMRQRLAAFERDVMRDLAMYMWEDPYIDLPLVKRPAEGLEFPFRWTSESREGDFSQYNIQIEPFSLRSSTPEERLSKLNQFMTQVVIPAKMPFDGKKYARSVAKYTNLIELEDILNVPPGTAPVQTEGGSNIPQTKRTYENINRPGPSAKPAEEQMLEQSLFGGGNGQQQPMGAT